MPMVKIPFFLKNTTMAIHEKRGGGIDAFVQSFAIARAHLTKNGYLTRGSEDGPVEKIKLTSKGKQKESEHRRKIGRRNKQFDDLFAKAQLKIQGGGAVLGAARAKDAGK